MRKFYIPKTTTLHAIEHVLIDSCSYNFNNRYGSHCKVEYNYSFRYADIKLYFKSLFYLLFSLHDSKRVTQYKIEGINIGISAYAMALKNSRVYTGRHWLYWELLIRLLISTREYIIGTKIVKDLKSDKECAVYLRDLAYTDSIIFDLCMQSSIGVYTITFPYSMSFYNEKGLNAVNVRKYPFPKSNITNEQYSLYMTGRMSNPNDYISYYSPKEDVGEYDDSLVFNKEDIVALIYAHSFSDGQMFYGYDGFTNVYDWLCFTIDTLLIKGNIKIVVKAHPNFWSIGHIQEEVECDQKIWQLVKKRYKNTHLVEFIDRPIDNKLILEKTNKNNTIVVSHHSNALAEAAYFGCKTISSFCSPWGDEYYNFSNTWKTKKQYSLLLNNFNVLKDTKINKLKNYVTDKLYNNDSGRGGDLIASESGIKRSDIFKDPEYATKDKFDNYDQSIKRISRLIDEFKL